MKLIVAGSRDITGYHLIASFIEHSQFDPNVIIQGGASGVDTEAKKWALRNDISFEEYKASWEKYGKAAGPIRNEEMAEAGDALLAIWDGESAGTEHMIEVAKDAGIPREIKVVEQ